MSTQDPDVCPPGVEKCRLCDGELTLAFTGSVMGKHAVRYSRCNACLSLQTEQPFWLQEAYEKTNLANTDTGAAQRNLTNLAACFAIAKLFKAYNVIDVGGGDGLLCRLLRDYDINCFVKDKYAAATYAQGYFDEDFENPDLLVAFEVLEHYPNPKSDLNDLFSRAPRFVLVSTEIYSNQTRDWWYLAPETGQHVFFYSLKALEEISSRYGYHLVVAGRYIFFARTLRPASKLLVRLLLHPRTIRLLRSVVAFLPTPGVYADNLVQVERSRNEQSQHC
jgi:hypothetical protein